MDLIIGSHVSFKSIDELVGSVKEALSYNANAFMFYTGAPQNTVRKDISEEKIKEALKLMDNKIDIKNVVVHAPYIVNLANRTNIDFNVSFLKQEIDRCHTLGIKKMVLHPGSAVKYTKEEGLANIVEALDLALKDDKDVIILIETMAGKGTELGVTFEEIKYIIEHSKYNNLLGVCLDTCHLNDAGYDVSKFDSLLDEFNKIVGIDKIGCVHINDSKNVFSSHKDRHENIGYGTLSFDTLISIIYNEKLKDVPKILETPYIENNDGKKVYPPYKFEIEMIKNKKFNSKLIEEVRDYYK